jgi:hypothetical protein
MRKMSSIIARKGFDGALNAHSAFSNLLARKATEKDVQAMLGSKDFSTVLAGAREFLQAHADWIHDGVRTETYTIRDLLKPQDMFLRTEVSTEEEMKVSGIGRLWNRNGKNVITETRAEVGLWQVSPDMKLWGETIAQKLVDERAARGVQTLDSRIVREIYFNNRENVADDPLILDRVVAESGRFTLVDTVYLFTQDRQRWKRAANMSGMSVLRISPSTMLSFVKDELGVQDFIMSFDGNPVLANRYITGATVGRKTAVLSYVDTGSIAETLMNHENNSGFSGRVKSDIFKREVQSYGRDFRGRYEILSYKKIAGGRLGIVDLRIKDNRGRSAYEIFRPQKTVRTRAPRFEAYKDGESLRSRSTGTSTSNGSLRKRPPAPSENLY